MIGLEADLLLRTAQGDVLAFEKLTKAYYRPLHAFFFRMSSDSQYAENLVQETLLRIFKYSSSFDPSRKAKSWIFSIAANVARDWNARQVKKMEIPVEDASLGAEKTGSVVEDEVERRQQSESITRALNALDEKHRQVFILKHFHHMRYHEIALVLETSEGTVKSRMYYACRQLRKLLPSMGKVAAVSVKSTEPKVKADDTAGNGEVMSKCRVALGSEIA